MKVYLIYASIPRSIFEDIATLLPNTNIWVYDDETSIYHGLYAWTKDRELYKDFIKVRKGCKFYRSIEKSMDKYDYKIFKKEYSDLKLGYFKFSRGEIAEIIHYKGEPSVIFPSTRWEYESVDSEEGLCEIYYLFMPDEMADYYAFNNQIIDALDTLGYTTDYDISYGGDPDCFTDEEQSNRMEYAGNNCSYGLTVNGRKYPDIYSDKFAVFMKVMKCLIMDVS